MLPFTPFLAARLRTRMAITTAVGLGVGLIVAATYRGGDASEDAIVPVVPSAYPAVTITPVEPPVVTPVPQHTAIVLAPVVPDANPANLVGIYRARSCTLTLDASGTYLDSCYSAHRNRYRTAGNSVVLEHLDGSATGAQRLTITKHNELVTTDGTVYSLAGGRR